MMTLDIAARYDALPPSAKTSLSQYLEFLEVRFVAGDLARDLSPDQFSAVEETVMANGRCVVKSRAEYAREFGERLRAARDALGMSEQEAAESYGVGVQAYHRWEAGAPGSRYGHKRLLDYATVHGLSLDWLVGGKGTMFREGYAAPPARPADATTRPARRRYKVRERGVEQEVLDRAMRKGLLPDARRPERSVIDFRAEAARRKGGAA